MESNGPSQPRDEEPLTPGSATKVPLVRAWLREEPGAREPSSRDSSVLAEPEVPILTRGKASALRLPPIYMGFSQLCLLFY